MKPFQIACAGEPARSVGGDYFDVLTLGPDRLGICIADVSGKGITAALLMANLQATVRAFAPVCTGPGALCSKLNEVLCGSIAPGKFVTFFYGVIDVQLMGHADIQTTLLYVQVTPQDVYLPYARAVAQHIRPLLVTSS